MKISEELTGKYILKKRWFGVVLYVQVECKTELEADIDAPDYLVKTERYWRKATETDYLELRSKKILN